MFHSGSCQHTGKYGAQFRTNVFGGTGFPDGLVPTALYKIGLLPGSGLEFLVTYGIANLNFLKTSPLARNIYLNKQKPTPTF